jgi:toxin ParE1/3/4
VRYFFHPDAGAEHLAQVSFYESRRRGLGGRYLASFDTVMKRVCGGPMRYRVVWEPNLRRALLTAFPFAIIYRNAKVEVLAVAHQRRRPGYWAAGT